MRELAVDDAGEGDGEGKIGEGVGIGVAFMGERTIKGQADLVPLLGFARDRDGGVAIGQARQHERGAGQGWVRRFCIG